MKLYNYIVFADNDKGGQEYDLGTTLARGEVDCIISMHVTAQHALFPLELGYTGHYVLVNLVREDLLHEAGYRHTGSYDL